MKGKTFIKSKKDSWDRRRGHSFVARTRPSTAAERPGPKVRWRLRQLEPCRTHSLPLRGRKRGRKGTSRDGVVIITTPTITTTTTPTTMKKIQSRMIAKLTRAITVDFLSCQRTASR